MATFENIFPTFLSKCGELHTLLQLVAYVLFVVGIIVFVAHGFTRRQLFRYLTRLLVLTALLVFLPDWGNALQDLLNNSILSGLGVDPSDVHNQYKQLLDVKKPDASDVAWWDLVSRITSATVETMISAFLFLIGKVAAFILWWAYVFQKIILHLGYALSPILIGFMGLHALKHTGARYLLHLVGVLLWPLGWAVAALVTQAVLDFMTDPTFKVLDPTSAFYYLQNQFGVAVLGFWIIFSTFASPIIIQKVLVSGALAGSELLTHATRTAIQSTTAAVGGAAVAAPYGMPILTAAAAGTAGILTTISSGTETGQGGAIILASSGLPARAVLMSSRDDITGDRAIRHMLAQQRNRFSEPSILQKPVPPNLAPPNS